MSLKNYYSDFDSSMLSYKIDVSLDLLDGTLDMDSQPKT